LSQYHDKESYVSSKAKEKGSFRSPSLYNSPMPFFLWRLRLDRENSPLTRPCDAVAGLTDTTRLFKGVHPHGVNDGAVKPRTDLLEKHNMPRAGQRKMAMEGENVIR
jgi:hypothetical protein